MADLSQLSSEELLALRSQAQPVDLSSIPTEKLLEMKRVAAQQQDGLTEKANSFLGGAVEGMPIVGPYLKSGAEKAAAGIRSVMHGSPYDDELKAVQEYAKKNAQAHPYLNTGGNVAGAVIGTAPMVAAAPAAFGVGGGSMGARMAASGASGAAIGGADAAVRSDFDPYKTAIGTTFGGVTGAAAPPIAAAMGRGAAYVADRFGRASDPAGPVGGLSRPAVNYAVDAVGDVQQQSAIRNELQRLGPQATLADVSPEWLGVARGAASQPSMRGEVATPLLNRDAAKNVRLRSDVNRAIGPAQVPSQIDETITAGQRALSPQYQDVFRNARAVNTEGLANTITGDTVNLRGPAQRAAQQVRGMLDIHGAPGNLDPHPGTLFQTRQAIDGMLAGETNPQVVRVLSGYRQQVDDILSQAVPRLKEVDARFAELARQREALTRGQQVLDSGRTAPRPQELAQEVAEGAIPQGQMTGPSAVPLRLRQGARAEIDRVVGTNANDPVALQRLMRSEGDWNRDRLRTLFGPRADDVLGAVDRETTFARTANRVTAGSDTAMANRFGDFLDKAATPANVPTDTTVTGALLRGLQKTGQKALGVNAEEKAARFARELGRLSVAQGGERDVLVEALLELAQRRQSLEPLRYGSEALARALLSSTPPVANQQLLAR